jgi:hypothetical protein
LVLALWALIALGSLYPLSGWREPIQPWTDWLLADWPRWVRLSEWLVNLFLYALAAFLLVQWLCLGSRRLPPVIVAGLLGMAASLVFESAQAWLPERIPSNADLLANAMGAWLGAILAWLVPIAPARLWPLERMLALLLLLVWPLSQWVSASGLPALTGSLTPSEPWLTPVLLWMRRLGIDRLSLADYSVQVFGLVLVLSCVLLLSRLVFATRRQALVASVLLLWAGWMIGQGWAWPAPQMLHGVAVLIGLLVFLLTPRAALRPLLLALLLGQAVLASLLPPSPYSLTGAAAPGWLNLDVWLALLNRAWPWTLVLLLARRSL